MQEQILKSFSLMLIVSIYWVHSLLLCCFILLVKPSEPCYHGKHILKVAATDNECIYKCLIQYILPIFSDSITWIFYIAIKNISLGILVLTFDYYYQNRSSNACIITKSKACVLVHQLYFDGLVHERAREKIDIHIPLCEENGRQIANVALKFPLLVEVWNVLILANLIQGLVSCDSLTHPHTHTHTHGLLISQLLQDSNESLSLSAFRLPESAGPLLGACKTLNCIELNQTIKIKCVCVCVFIF